MNKLYQSKLLEVRTKEQWIKWMEAVDKDLQNETTKCPWERVKKVLKLELFEPANVVPSVTGITDYTTVIALTHYPEYNPDNEKTNDY